MSKTHQNNATALNPQYSVVIEACAGSGKTWLLVSRILRLLLDGVEPSEILAITFTRKATVEVRARLNQGLQLLALGEDQEVRAFLRARELSAIEIDNLLPRARNLYETVLTANPGITIQTFHGWFMQILKSAPLEWRSYGAINLLEQTSLLMEEAWQTFAEEMELQPNDKITLCLNNLFERFGLNTTRTMLWKLLHKRSEWWAYTAGAADPVAHTLKEIERDLPAPLSDDVVTKLFSDLQCRADVKKYIDLLARNTLTDQGCADDLSAAVAQGNVITLFDALSSVVFNADGLLRSRKPSKAQVSRLADCGGEQHFLELHNRLGEKLAQTRYLFLEQENYRLNHDVLTCGNALLLIYQRLKKQRQQLDHTDVEWGANQLLTRSDYAEFMQFKFESRYKHILLDEFQDTNPLQWQTMMSWLVASEEANLKSSVFIVGDPKQSIYRFRRADSRLFYTAKNYLCEKYDACYLKYHVSRRNAPAIIDIVNRVFETEPKFINFREHVSHQPNLPGRVELFPLNYSEKSAQAETLIVGLRNPLLQARIEYKNFSLWDEARQFAEKIKAIVQHWVVNDENGHSRLVEYKDIMVLVRRRTHLAETYERALRDADIPYISSSQGRLLETLEAMDLIALLEFLIAPVADLALAQVLRSPIFNCSDSDLMGIAKVSGGTWWQRIVSLMEVGKASATLQGAYRLLKAWLTKVDTLPVHDLLDNIYFEGDLINRYSAAVPTAMRNSVAANLTAFLELALNVNAGRYPSLPRFITELRSLQTSSAEEAPDEGALSDYGNAIRIYTVHAAKGLEAPIVWLLDTHMSPRANESQKILIDWPTEAVKPQHFSIANNKPSIESKRAAYIARDEEHEEREDLNLLYVAMTRAKQILLVSANNKTTSSTTWYTKIRDAMVKQTGQHGEEGAIVIHGQNLETHGDNKIETANVVKPIAVDAKFNTPFFVGLRNPQLKIVAIEQGTQFHNILEHRTRTDITPDKSSLRQLLGITDDEFNVLWNKSTAFLSSPLIAKFFDAKQYVRAINEMSYVNENGDIRRIDRLVEFNDCVWVLDYKTGKKPESEQWAQLRDYTAAMRGIFPEKKIRAALLFSDGRMYELDN